jgi:Ni/Co efflux regulator RcnB
MKRSLAVAMALALTVGGAQVAFAQPDRHDDHHMQGPQHHDWHNGGRIAQEDWKRGQRVDYRSRHLKRPPRGYEWRQVDGNYVMAAAATGLIAGLVLAH